MGYHEKRRCTMEVVEGGGCIGRQESVFNKVEWFDIPVCLL